MSIPAAETVSPALVSDPTAVETAARPLSNRRDAAAGVALAVLAAVCASITTIALRGVTRDGNADWAVWVTCMKALPSAIVSWLIIAVLVANGRKNLMPPVRQVVLLTVIGFFVQTGGNVFFQWSLAMCGLALSVPTVFATLMVTGALLGRFYLGESVTVRSAVATGLLIAAIGLLSLGAKQAAAALPPGPPGVSPALWVLGGIGLSGVAGIFYGCMGVVLRRTGRQAISLPVTLAIISTTGVVGLGVPAVARLGFAGLTSTTLEMVLMVTAGLFNVIAFYAMASALRRIPVVQVNLLNSSQAAMCGLGGVLVFQEPLTASLIAGISLTIFGLAMMSRSPRPAES